jgi:hypothetical protein
MPLRLGDQNETVRIWRATMNARFGGDTGLYARLHGTLPTDTDKFGPRAVLWQREYQVRTQRIPWEQANGEVSDHDLLALGISPSPVIEPDVVAFSVNGAGSQWNFGYPIDMVHRSVPDYTRDIFDQPIGYDTRPVPMNRGVTGGEAELVSQLARPRGVHGRNCTELLWTGVWYSMGALVGRRVVDRVLHGDLQQYKHTFLGDVALGNPRRQRNHTFPGCPAEWSGGEGIATPTDHDLPEQCWDLAADKRMPGSGGDDLYTKMADDENERTTKNMRAVWDIINRGNPLTLAVAVLQLMAHPDFEGGYAAAGAAFKALDFFVVKATGPHVRYQFTLPLPNDPRDCFEIGRAHIADLIARRQPIFG